MVGLAASLFVGGELAEAGVDWRVNFGDLGGDRTRRAPVPLRRHARRPAHAPRGRRRGEEASLGWRFWRADALFVFVNAMPVIVGAWLLHYLTIHHGIGPGIAGALGFVLFGVLAVGRPLSGKLATSRHAASCSRPSGRRSRPPGSSLSPSIGPKVWRRSGSSRSASASAFPTRSRTSASRICRGESRARARARPPGRQLRRDRRRADRGRRARARVRAAVLPPARRLLRARRWLNLMSEETEPRCEHACVVAGAADQLQRRGQAVLGRCRRGVRARASPSR